jgi:hypothetical protein
VKCFRTSVVYLRILSQQLRGLGYTRAFLANEGLFQDKEPRGVVGVSLPAMDKGKSLVDPAVIRASVILLYIVP